LARLAGELAGAAFIGRDVAGASCLLGLVLAMTSVSCRFRA
jgi:hypothetical protein